MASCATAVETAQLRDSAHANRQSRCRNLADIHGRCQEVVAGTVATMFAMLGSIARAQVKEHPADDRVGCRQHVADDVGTRRAIGVAVRSSFVSISDETMSLPMYCKRVRPSRPVEIAAAGTHGRKTRGSPHRSANSGFACAGTARLDTRRRRCGNRSRRAATIAPTRVQQHRTDAASARSHRHRQRRSHRHASVTIAPTYVSEIAPTSGSDRTITSTSRRIDHGGRGLGSPRRSTACP